MKTFNASTASIPSEKRNAVSNMAIVPSAIPTTSRSSFELRARWTGGPATCKTRIGVYSSSPSSPLEVIARLRSANVEKMISGIFTIS